MADYRGTDRAGGNVAALARASSDTATLWTATTTGRILISKNAHDATAGNRVIHVARFARCEQPWPVHQRHRSRSRGPESRLDHGIEL